MRFVGLLPLVFLTACGGTSETISHSDSEGTTRSIEVNDSGGKRTVTSGDGLIKAEGTQGGAEARFPAYAPQYPGAKVQSVVNMDVGGSVKHHVITQMTSDTPDAVMAFYKAKVAASGKAVKELKSATGPMLMIGGKSLMDMEGSVTAMPVPSGGTSVNVSVQERTK